MVDQFSRRIYLSGNQSHIDESHLQSQGDLQNLNLNLKVQMMILVARKHRSSFHGEIRTEITKDITVNCQLLHKLPPRAASLSKPEETYL